MIITRIYQPQILESQKHVQLDAAGSHHLARVLRAKVGDKVQVFNGDGNLHTAIITEISKQKVVVMLETMLTPATESTLNLQLAQGIAKGEKMDWIIQKAIELGVKHIYPLFTERCNVQLANERVEKKLNHWQAIAHSACEQSGRVCLPIIYAPMPLTSYLTTLANNMQCYILSPHHPGKLVKPPTSANISVIVGPEGGLTANEVAQALDAGCIPLHLGPRILRTETASIAALTIMQSQFGDM